MIVARMKFESRRYLPESRKEIWQYRRGFHASSIMYSVLLKLCLAFLVPYVGSQETNGASSFRNEKALHVPAELSSTQVSRLASLSNVAHMNETLDNICIVRVVGTPGHKKVKDYLKSSMQNLGWTIETDVFNDKPPCDDPLKTPCFELLEFENIVAKLNPNAKRYLTLACHFDSKYTREGDFVGATDSAVPCAQLLNLATVMKDQLTPAKTSNISLMFIFFDGEEAFNKWGPKDSIYGARHLAQKWHNTKQTYGNETDISDLDKMDMLILLDLLGAPDPLFYNYFSDTERWYAKLMHAEQILADLRAFTKYSYGNPQQRYFQPYSVPSYVEDDHIPFLQRNVPIVHLIPYQFPSFWHTSGDNRSIIDMDTTENLNKILRVFVASYLKLDV